MEGLDMDMLYWLDIHSHGHPSGTANIQYPDHGCCFFDLL
jgi:hypothetical protein